MGHNFFRQLQLVPLEVYYVAVQGAQIKKQQDVPVLRNSWQIQFKLLSKIVESRSRHQRMQKPGLTPLLRGLVELKLLIFHLRADPSHKKSGIGTAWPVLS